jgi:hypothetical protein
LLTLFLDCYFVPEGTLMGRQMDILRARLSSVFAARDDSTCSSTIFLIA